MTAGDIHRTPRFFEWDPDKDEANARKQGIGFRTATAIFADPRHRIEDVGRLADREHRLKATGLIDGKLHVVVYVWRGERARLISARRANTSETRRYGPYRLL